MLDGVISVYSRIEIDGVVGGLMVADPLTALLIVRG